MGVLGSAMALAGLVVMATFLQSKVLVQSSKTDQTNRGAGGYTRSSHREPLVSTHTAHRGMGEWVLPRRGAVCQQLHPPVLCLRSCQCHSHLPDRFRARTTAAAWRPLPRHSQAHEPSHGPGQPMLLPAPVVTDGMGKRAAAVLGSG